MSYQMQTVGQTKLTMEDGKGCKQNSSVCAKTPCRNGTPRSSKKREGTPHAQSKENAQDWGRQIDSGVTDTWSIVAAQGKISSAYWMKNTD